VISVHEQQTSDTFSLVAGRIVDLCAYFDLTGINSEVNKTADNGSETTLKANAVKGVSSLAGLGIAVPRESIPVTGGISSGEGR
jgi:hypothetical protein